MCIFCREIDNLHSMLNNLQSAPHVPDDSMDVVMEVLLFNAILYDSPDFMDEEKKDLGINVIRNIIKFSLQTYMSLLPLSHDQMRS